LKNPDNGQFVWIDSILAASSTAEFHYSQPPRLLLWEILEKDSTIPSR
jgi:hypothetical protein